LVVVALMTMPKLFAVLLLVTSNTIFLASLLVDVQTSDTPIILDLFGLELFHIRIINIAKCGGRLLHQGGYLPGLFGILALFIAIKTVTGVGIIENPWWWTTDWWKIAVVVTLSIAYLGLITLGLACYLWRRQFDALIDEYLDNAYSKFQNDLRRVAQKKWLTRAMFKLSWSGSLEQRRHRGIRI
jgi:hypothetical protein